MNPQGAMGLLRAAAVLILAYFTCPNVGQECDYQLVETMPEKLTYKQGLPFNIATTHEVFLDLINNAKHSIQVASFYVSLLPADQTQANHPSAEPGRLVFEALESAARDRNIKVELVLGMKWSTPIEMERFNKAGVNVKFLNVTGLLGSGVQHSKFIITDNENFYLGSANWDWRALTQVKEFGIVYKRCPTLAQDLGKVYQTYSYMSDQTSVPETVPESMISTINSNSSLNLVMDNIESNVYLGTSPPQFNGQNNHRTDDIDALLETIANARKYVYISVMNYSPVNAYGNKFYWPVIDDALRAAYFERKVNVKLLVSTKGRRFRNDELNWLKSLDALSGGDQRYGGVEVKFFTLPSYDDFQAKIPHARLKHDKYIVTDNSVYIGTSNWEPGYFINTCGVGMSIRPDYRQMMNNPQNIVSNIKAVFERDYYSEFSQKASEY